MHQRKAQSEQERGFAGVTVVAIMDGVRLGEPARRSNKVRSLLFQQSARARHPHPPFLGVA